MNSSDSLLIVRLSALGDIVHALPVLDAVRRAHPDAAVDWLVEEAYAPILALVPGLRRRIVVRAKESGHASEGVFGGGARGYLDAVRFLRGQRYDMALDLQGLIKSAAWARLSGARRVIGFDRGSLREPQAAWFYTETVTPPAAPHVIQKNLTMTKALGLTPAPFTVPMDPGEAPQVARAIDDGVGAARYAVLNPGAAWPNKRWPPDRFGALAAALLHRHGLMSFVTWGPAERDLAQQVVDGSSGAALLAPPTSVAELAVLLGGASLVVSGDTGPLHIAAAMGAPIVGLYGPTWPERNGPWEPDDEVISRALQCQCHHKRSCQIGQPCIEDIQLDEVAAAADRRLARARQRAGLGA